MSVGGGRSFSGTEYYSSGSTGTVSEKVHNVTEKIGDFLSSSDDLTINNENLQNNSLVNLWNDNIELIEKIIIGFFGFILFRKIFK